MLSPESVFKTIEQDFIHNFPEVESGNMMRADALKVNGKVFCFFHEENMTFKLGKGVDMDRPELAEATFLSPFKHKPPMKAWLIIPFTTPDMWKALAEEAMEKVAGGK